LKIINVANEGFVKGIAFRVYEEKKSIDRKKYINNSNPKLKSDVLWDRLFKIILKL